MRRPGNVCNKLCTRNSHELAVLVAKRPLQMSYILPKLTKQSENFVQITCENFEELADMIDVFEEFNLLLFGKFLVMLSMTSMTASQANASDT